MTKAPTPTEMSKGQSDNTNNATKKFVNGEYIVKISRGIVELDYEVKPFGFLEVWHKIPLVTI